MMNRRNFLRNLFASSAAVVVAPAVALELLDAEPRRTYVDMGKNLDRGWYAHWRETTGGHAMLEPGSYVIDIESVGLSDDGHYMVIQTSRGEVHQRFIGKPRGLGPKDNPVIEGPSGRWAWAR